MHPERVKPPLRLRPLTFLILLVLGFDGSHLTLGQSLDRLVDTAARRARSKAIKPEHTPNDPTDDPRQLIVTFKDGLHLRVRDKRLVSLEASELEPLLPMLNSLPDAKWKRLDRVSEDQLDAWRQTAQLNLGRTLPDLNLQFRLILPATTNAAPIIDALNALDMVELAEPVRAAPQLPAAPDFVPLQIYQNIPPTGVGGLCTWTNCNLHGENIKVALIEYSFTTGHTDLPNVTVLGGDLMLGAQINPNAEAHGTGTLGVMASLDNGIGTTGLAPNATYFFHGIWELDEDFNIPVYDIPSSITTSAAALNAGDVLLVELGAPGFSYAVEWDQPSYARIVLAIGLGIIVVEPAGNGASDFDGPYFSTGNGGHWPFLAVNDSGAIIVGAGAATPPAANTDVPRSRLPFSNYGSRVNLQGWGEGVVTTGGGDLYNLGGITQYYRLGYSGTSSAAPIVAGCCALLQSIYKNKTQTILPPTQIRQILMISGTPQQAGLFPITQHIGPLPNLKNAVQLVIPPKVYLSTQWPQIIVTWDGCGYLETITNIGPTANWNPIGIGVSGNTYSIDLSSEKAPTRFFRVTWR